MPRRRDWRPAGVVLLCALLAAGAAAQEEEEDLGWSDTAQFSIVVTSGNAESQTLGFLNELRRRWPKALFRFELGAIHAESTEKTAVAVGPDNDDFEMIEEERTTTNAERYHLDLTYYREINKRLYWNVGGGWERNRPSGIDNRYQLLAGLGHRWVDGEKVKFRTEYGLTWTRREDVVPDPETDDSFVGLRLAVYYLQEIGDHTTYKNELVFNDNLQSTSDYWVDWLNSFGVSISRRLALKVGLRLLYENEPALRAVPREFPLGTPTGDVVLTPLEDLDSIFTTSLVVNF